MSAAALRGRIRGRIRLIALATLVLGLVFSPLLDRFFAGEDYHSRAVKVSDSGRIRNELLTLCSDALEHNGTDRIRVYFDRIDDAVLPPEKKAFITEVLRWYKEHHPVWFGWLEIAG